MPQLDPTWFLSQLFWLLVTFVTLYLVLSRWALPRVEKTLAHRKDTLASDIERADRMTAEAERTRAEYERTMAESRAKAQQFFADVAAEQKSRADEAGKAMDTKVAVMLSEAQKKIEAQKKNLLDALIPASSELAGMVVEKLTHQTSADSNKAIAAEIMKFRNR